MTSAPKKIIIVEDQPTVADLFEDILSADQYQVIKIHSSTGTLSVIQAEKPDVVLLDIMMPDVSGLEVLRFIRREGFTAYSCGDRFCQVLAFRYPHRVGGRCHSLPDQAS